MKKLLTLASLVLLLGGAGEALAVPCANASLSDYVSIGATGCSTGGLTLSSFSVEAFPGPAATQIDPASVTLAPFANGFSLLSGTALSASAGDLLGLRVLFHVTATNLFGGTISLADRSVTPDAAITAILDAGTLGNAIAFDIGVDAAQSAAFSTPPSGFFDVFVELGIDGGLSGSASAGSHLASVSFATQPIPEPDTALLLGIGLLGIVLLRRLRPQYSR